MAGLRIPDQHVNGLIKVRALEEKRVQELVAALADAPIVMWGKQLAKAIAPKIRGMSETEIDEILVALIGMSLARFQLDLSPSDFAERICSTMEQSENEHLRLTGKECDSFRDRLVRLLAPESLMYPAKAFGILSGHDRVFTYGRVLTDIRPIFGSAVDVQPKAAVLVQVLNVMYQSDGENYNLYLAMDSSDIRSLITTLNRALTKAESLNQMLDTTGIVCLNPE